MDESDLLLIERVFVKVIDAKLGDFSVEFDAKLEAVSARFDAKLEAITANFDAKFEHFKDEIIVEFDHRLRLQTEIFQHGLSLVGEVHQLLSEKMDRIGTRVNHTEARSDNVEWSLTQRLNKISAEVAAHRLDTAAHNRV